MLDWETLKKLTGSTFARYVILVPVVGWLLVYQNAFADLVSKLLGFEVALSLSWELLIFYLGLVLLGVASAIFRFFGPDPVLNHRGLQGYADDTEAILTRKEFALLCERIGCEQPADVTVPAAGTGQIVTLDQWKRLNSENIRDTLSQHYRTVNVQGVFWRGFTTITFVIGAVFTLTPTVKTVVWATREVAFALR